MSLLYAQSSGSHSTNQAAWSAIPGLTIALPAGVGITAIIILNVPNPYAQGDNNPGGNFGVLVDKTVQPVTAAFTYNEQKPSSFGRVPTTLVLGVPLTANKQTVTAVWASIRNSNVVIDTPATLTALLD
jgi:Bc2l-C, N-terminal domain